jgi:thymidylate kinase
MTTPQNNLDRLAQRIEHLTDMFEPEGLEGEEDAETIFEAIKEMRREVSELIAGQQRQQDLMSIIIKMLIKDQ